MEIIGKKTIEFLHVRGVFRTLSILSVMENFGESSLRISRVLITPLRFYKMRYPLSKTVLEIHNAIITDCKQLTIETPEQGMKYVHC